jgi:hypothetical protein
VNLALWALCEAAIIACDLAEVIGTAIALKLLFDLPLWGAVITALDTLLVLLLMNRGFRALEAFVIALLMVIFALLRGADRDGRTAGDGGAGRLHARAGGDRSARAVHRHRHHWRHGDAAQPVPAFVHRADPRLPAHR